jgi:hypothetical protein
MSGPILRIMSIKASGLATTGAVLIEPNRAFESKRNRLSLCRRNRVFTTFEVALLRHGTISRLARSAALNANLPCGTGPSFVARIFSMTRSIK